MTDKARRKQIRDELRRKAKEEFETSLPMSRAQFEGLFDYLNLTLQKEVCNDDYALALWYLELVGIKDSDEVIGWLLVNGGYCDCEILANVEELFER